MNIVLLMLTALSLCLSVSALFYVQHYRQKVAQALQNTESMAASIGMPSGEAVPALNNERDVLTIEILNPMELAAEKSWIAGTISSISPGFIRRKVYEQTRGILEEKLIEFGVQADVQVVRRDR